MLNPTTDMPTFIVTFLFTVNRLWKMNNTTNNQQCWVWILFTCTRIVFFPLQNFSSILRNRWVVSTKSIKKLLQQEKCINILVSEIFYRRLSIQSGSCLLMRTTWKHHYFCYMPTYYIRGRIINSLIVPPGKQLWEKNPLLHRASKLRNNLQMTSVMSMNLWACIL